MSTPSQPAPANGGVDSKLKIFLLPNLFTAANLFCGFLALTKIVEADLNAATYPAVIRQALFFILLACIFDLLDGRVARMGGFESPFGREFDSLADIVSFGIAPALLVHDIVLQEFERMVSGGGWLIACVYLVCGAMRLARFNCLAARESQDPDSAKSFRGCPIPAAAGVIVSLTLTLLWLDGENREIGRWKYALPVLMLLLSYLMVSNLEYPSFKSINFRTRRSFHWALVSILVVFMLIMAWQWMPTVIFVSYLLYGLARPWVSRRWRQEIENLAEAPPEENASSSAANGDAEPPTEAKSDPASLI